MANYLSVWHVGTASALALSLSVTSPESKAQEEFGETKAIIEINATDGDVGFHVFFDADAWKEVRIRDPQGKQIFKESARRGLLEQGLTENFFESSEPLCQPDPEEPEALVVPLGEFLERFPPGEYLFGGTTLEGDPLEGTAELTYALPAAPEILMFDGTSVTWGPGVDLGGCQDDSLVNEGVIPNPAEVEVVGWEIAVEPVDDEAVDPLRTFRVQLPPTVTSLVIPSEFLDAYIAEGVTDLKVEVGAIEASGNQTFTEAEFEFEPAE